MRDELTICRVMPGPRFLENFASFVFGPLTALMGLPGPLIGHPKKQAVLGPELEECNADYDRNSSWLSKFVVWPLSSSLRSRKLVRRGWVNDKRLTAKLAAQLGDVHL
jgi:hypothetical protein